MRPPICFLCNQDFAPSVGELVHFAASTSGIEWDQRSDRPDRTLSGHHPDQGWFCQAHSQAALKLAPTHTLDQALRELRQGS